MSARALDLCVIESYSFQAAVHHVDAEHVLQLIHGAG